MTVAYRQKIHCTNCGIEISAETSFSRWIRNRKDLDSNGVGISVMDADWIIHRFRTELGRSFQCLMILEVKTRGGEMSYAQRDTVNTLDQLLRNRVKTPTSNPIPQARNGVRKVDSVAARSSVFVRAFGVHVLTFENLGPDDSTWITWDAQKVDVDQLASLLRFDLDPDTLRPMDWRSHHRRREIQWPLL